MTKSTSYLVPQHNPPLHMRLRFVSLTYCILIQCHSSLYRPGLQRNSNSWRRCDCGGRENRLWTVDGRTRCATGRYGDLRVVDVSLIPNGLSHRRALANMEYIGRTGGIPPILLSVWKGWSKTALSSNPDCCWGPGEDPKSFNAETPTVGFKPNGFMTRDFCLVSDSRKLLRDCEARLGFANVSR